MSLPHHRIYGSTTYNQPSRRPERLGKNKKNTIPWFKRVLFVCLGFGALIFIIGTIFIVQATRNLPDPTDPNQIPIAQSTKIYDRTGQHLLYETYADQKRTKISLDQMSSYLPKAVISIEDKDFYHHNGIRIPSIIRAGFSNLFHLQTGRGGASTITQQFLKNRVLGQQRTLTRKIQEFIMAIELEKKVSKETILTAYLNEIWFGSTNYGVESASQTYLGKKSKDLNLSESATIAALIQNPRDYIKPNNKEYLVERRDTVLDNMLEQGYISQEERDAAKKEEVRISLAGGVFDAPHFVIDVRSWLEDKFTKTAVRTEGYKVITTLDYDKQKIAEAAVKEFGEKFLKDYNANNEALVALDPKTGQILAEVGSRDYNNKEIDGNYNVVSQGMRQPGSSFKPFVFLDAFEKGYTPDTVLYDVKTDFDLGNGTFKPSNALRTDNGLVTMRKALQGSLNIPAIKTLYLIGSEKEGRNIAERFGYHLDKNQTFGLTMVIGGAEMNMLEHANAYNTLANNGTFNPPISVLKVEDDKGKVLYEWKPESKQVVKPELVATLDDVLTDNNARSYVFGPKSNLVLADRLVAAKTGTTDNDKDAWQLGYTPSLTAAVWVGNTKPKQMKAGGEVLAGQIWKRFMSEALKGTPVEKFPAPPPKELGLKPVLAGSDGGIKIKVNSLNGKIATSSTPPDLIEEKTFLPPHDILYYVNRDDPRGPIPEPPCQDQQCENWEKYLQDWITRQQEKGIYVTLEDVPTEFDNPTDPTLAPTIELISPNSTTITSRDLQFSVKATGPRGVSKVEYRIDNISAGSSSAPPFTISYSNQNLTKGEHKLEIIASDDQGNQGYKQVILNLQTDLGSPSIEWSGQQQTDLKITDFPRAFFLSPFRWDDIKEVKISLIAGNDQKTLRTFSNNDQLFGGGLTFTIDQPLLPGSYTLKARMIDKNNQTLEKDLKITVK